VLIFSRLRMAEIQYLAQDVDVEKGIASASETETDLNPGDSQVPREDSGPPTIVQVSAITTQ
jgi:hypothetical protein